MAGESIVSQATAPVVPKKSKRRKKKRNLRWESLVATFEAGDYVVVPLTSSNDLRDEGELMNHCVGRHYHRWCHDGAIRVFSIRDLDGRRLATASMYFDFVTLHWCFDQCQGYGNKDVCESTHQKGNDNLSGFIEQTDIYYVVLELARLYQRAYQDAQDSSA